MGGGGWAGEDTKWNALPDNGGGLYKMQTVDCRLLFLGLEHNGSVVATF